MVKYPKWLDKNILGIAFDYQGERGFFGIMIWTEPTAKGLAEVAFFWAF